MFRKELLSSTRELEGRDSFKEKKDDYDAIKGSLIYNFSKWMDYALNSTSTSLDIKELMELIGKLNAQYKNVEQQDVQEFMMWIFNQLSDELKKFKINNWITTLLEGNTIAKTKCICCESVTSIEENFMFLSLEVERCTSLTDALHHKFLATEVLKGENKFSCESCLTYQEADKTFAFKKLPRILIIQLKRFKYIASQQRFVRLDYRVQFPSEIRIESNEDATKKANLYELTSIIMHTGPGIQSGHYYTLAKCLNKWRMFDDSKVTNIDKPIIEEMRYCSPEEEIGGGACPYILVFSLTENR